MKHLVLKLDDIGRDSSRPVVDVVLWAMQNKMPISIGTIGTDLPVLPRELIELIQTANKAGYLEIWNHGHRHIRYDQVPLDVAVADLTDGHKAILDTFGIEPEGFGFPFNRYSEESVQAVKSRFPNYYVYETDFESFKLLSPEYNSLADGQPRSSYFFERLGTESGSQNILLQAHPPRWTKKGLQEFSHCVMNLIETRGYVCLSGRDAIDSTSNVPRSSAVSKVAHGVKKLSDQWGTTSDEYVPTLSNFKSYFLGRFNSDAQKNWHQVRAELFPFRPKKLLDIGCGLGNWSLPFWLSGECKSIILNDINQTIVNALKAGISSLQTQEGISIGSNNLLAGNHSSEDRVDFLVSANTFNYLDPVDFFRFAQSSVVSGGRMLVMLQTPAFNRLRYRLSSESKDRSVAAEVLASDFAMLLRRTYGLFADGFRHAYPVADVIRLASMFDFTLLSQFSPHGDSKEGGEAVYECLLFKKSINMGKAISTRPEWLDECQSTIGNNFGSKAFDLAGIPCSAPTEYFNYYNREWNYKSDISDNDRREIQAMKAAIDNIRQGSHFDISEIDRISSNSGPLRDLADRVKKIAASCALLDSKV
nr:methyltransferase domain-containing protein [uncultured Undibacterium sp.]